MAPLATSNSAAARERISLPQRGWFQDRASVRSATSRVHSPQVPVGAWIMDPLTTLMLPPSLPPLLLPLSPFLAVSVMVPPQKGCVAAKVTTKSLNSFPSPTELSRTAPILRASSSASSPSSSPAA